MQNIINMINSFKKNGYIPIDINNINIKPFVKNEGLVLAKDILVFSVEGYRYCFMKIKYLSKYKEYIIT